MNQSQERKSQRWSVICAVCVAALMLLVPVLGASLPDIMNGNRAPDTIAEGRFAEDTTLFDMDGASTVRASGDYKSTYQWKNTSGDLNICNVSGSSGTLTVADSTAGNAIAGNISWSTMVPVLTVYLDYTAIDAWNDNMVRVHLDLAGLYSSSCLDPRTVTFSVGGVTLFTHTWAKTDTTDTVDTNITITPQQLMQARVNDGEQSYFKITVTGYDSTEGGTFAGSEMFQYNATKLASRDNALLVSVVACFIFAVVGVFTVQPHINVPLVPKGFSNPKGGRF